MKKSFLKKISHDVLEAILQRLLSFTFEADAFFLIIINQYKLNPIPIRYLD